MLKVDGSDIIWAGGSAVAGRLNCCKDLFIVKGVEVGAEFVDFTKFPAGFTGGRVLLVGFYGGELFGEAGCNGGGFGEGFMSEVYGLVGGRVCTLSRQGAE